MEPSVKGVLIKLAKEYLIKNFGEEAVNNLIAQMEPRQKEVLSKKLILASTWYPEETYVALIDKAQKTFGKEDYGFSKELGRYLANESIPKIYKFLVRFGNPNFARKHTAPIGWRQMHNTGYLKVTITGPDSDIVQLTDFAFPNKAHTHVLMGFTQAALELSGVKNYSSTMTQCQAEGAPYCEYKSSWE